MAERLPTLFIIEDNDLDVIMTQRLIGKMGLDIHIVRAKNGEEALQLLRAPETPSDLQPPFTMLLDINMPRMSGFELLEALAGDELLNHISIFVMSTSNRQQDRDRAAKLRVSGYMEKPITREHLKDLFREQCNDEA